MKYSIKEKLKAVKSVLSGKETTLSAGRKLDAGEKTVRRWVNHYRERGVTGLKLHNGSYDGNFKVRVVQYMLKNHLSCMQTAIQFGIPGDGTVSKWLSRYEALGAEGLFKDGRGRKRSIMAKKTKKVNKKITGSVEDRLAALQAENEYLRAENAFLKKLDALIQEDQSAQNKRQKPSES